MDYELRDTKPLSREIMDEAIAPFRAAELKVF